MKIVFSFLCISSAMADTFDEEKVKVIDSFGQSYFLSKSVFPKDFVFKGGAPFTFEVSEEELENKKITMKKK
jgi:hypothetical protein